MTTMSLCLGRYYGTSVTKNSDSFNNTWRTPLWISWNNCWKRSTFIKQRQTFRRWLNRSRLASLKTGCGEELSTGCTSRTMSLFWNKSSMMRLCRGSRWSEMLMEVARMEDRLNKRLLKCVNSPERRSYCCWIIKKTTDCCSLNSRR